MSARTWIAVASTGVIAASLLWLGCGVKSPPVPPQQAVPERIEDLAAASGKDGIRLSWERPERYAGGGKMRDLGKFEILRAEDSAGYRPLVEIPVNDQQRFQQQRDFSYVDSATEIGHSYKYQVLSETQDGYRSAPSNEAETTRVVPKPPPNPENFVLPQPTPLP
jgi:hypothetical protein